MRALVAAFVLRFFLSWNNVFADADTATACVPGCNATWLEHVGLHASVPAGTEHLPDPSASTHWVGRCSASVARALVVAALATSRDANGSAAMYFCPGEPIGKYVHLGGASLLARVVSGEHYSLRTPDQPRSANKWAALRPSCTDTRPSAAGGARAWDCLFGTPVREASPPACLRLWDLRTSEAARSSTALLLTQGIIATAIAPLPHRGPVASASREPSVVRTRVDHNVPDALDRPGEYAVVHVRRGDACEFWLDERLPYQDIFWNVFGGRRPCFRWAVYEKEVRRLTDLYGFRNVAVVSEDMSAVEEAREALRATHNVMWLDYDRSRLAFVGKWIETRTDTDEATVESALEALRMAKGGSALVGHFYSHFTKAMYALMTGAGGVPAPWISVDGGGVRPWILQGQPLVDGLSNLTV